MSKKIKKKLGGRVLKKNFSLQTLLGFPKDEVSSFVESGDYFYWICHGLNYLASDFDEALWTPLCDIYGGEEVPTLEEISKILTRSYRLKGEWVNGGKTLGLWSLQTPDSIYSIYRHLSHKLGKKVGKEEVLEKIRGPYYGPLWELFEEVKRGLA